MEKWIASIIISCVFAFGSSVSAAELEGVEPGITPDQLMYGLDQLVENFQLFLTTSGKIEAELLLEMAKERLAEAKIMTEEKQHQFVDNLIYDYLEKLSVAEEKIAELIMKDKLTSDKLLQFENLAEEATIIDEDVVDILAEDVVEKIENQQEILVQIPAVVQLYDETIVHELRQKGLGYGKLAQVLLLSKASGKTVEEVSILFSSNDKGYGEVAEELGLHPSHLSKEIAKKQEETSTDKKSKE